MGATEAEGCWGSTLVAKDEDDDEELSFAVGATEADGCWRSYLRCRRRRRR